MTYHSVEDVEQAIRESRIETSEAMDRRILDMAGRELETAARRSRRSGNRSRAVASGSWLSGRSVLRFAVAATAVLALVGGLMFIDGLGSSGVVWAQVVERIAEADRFSFRMGIRLPGGGAQGPDESVRGDQQEDAAMKFFFSSVLGFRWDVYAEGEPAVSFVYPPNAEAGIGIDHSQRTWAYLPASHEPAAAPPESPVRDPEDYIRRFLARDHEELGARVIDGTEVEGVEVVDPPTQDGPDLRGVGRLWVSVETGLPMRIELVQRAEEQRVEWVLDFRWGEQVDADAFRPVAPSGYAQLPFDAWSAMETGGASSSR